MILITGGIGYIGAHFATLALQQGMDILIVDKALPEHDYVIDNIEQVSGVRPPYEAVDLCFMTQVQQLFKKYPQIDSVVHFAALKSVSQSFKEPTDYYHNNVAAGINLLQVMAQHDVHKIIYSSTAAVYAEQDHDVAYSETMPLGPISPYGHSKLMFENILTEHCKATSCHAISLRYFNAAGNHPSGLLGPTKGCSQENLMPIILNVACKHQDYLEVYGNDYPTRDGTPVRDFIHVDDLAEAHISALNILSEVNSNQIINLGCGTPHTVLELIQAFSVHNKVPIPLVFKDRRQGDIGIIYADIYKASRLLGWQPTRSLENIVIDAWNYIKKTNT